MRLLFCCLWWLACGPVPGESLGAGKTLTEFPGASEGMWTAARLLATVWKPGPRPAPPGDRKEKNTSAQAPGVLVGEA